MQRRLLREFLESERSELLSFVLGVAPTGEGVAPITSAGESDEEGYKLPKIVSKRFAKGSADGAGEGEAGEGGGAEGELG